MNTSLLNGEKVLIRVDFNVPLDDSHNISDDTRIIKSLPTINKVLDAGAAVILMSHLGRPKIVKGGDNTAQINKNTLKHIIPHISHLLGRHVQFASDTIGTEAFDKALALQAGEILLLENTRFLPGETKGDMDIAAKLAQLADHYINDAFGAAHRKHASTYTVAQYFDKKDRQLGLLMQSEIESANKVLKSPKRPLTCILGGAKVSDKIQLIEKLLDFTDHLLIGGGMSYTFIKAKDGKIGHSLVEDEHLELAIELINKAKYKNVELHLPEDSKCADDFNNEANVKTFDSDKIDEGWMGLDIGPKAIQKYSKIISESATILWNGPLGVFEFDKFANGTNSIAKAVAKATQNGSYSLIGGGDSVAAINKSGLDKQVSFISTGGGAMLEFLEGKTLPGIAAINAD